jgi:hypothetical protein
MLMMCSLGAMLVPCLVALFYFATPKTRQTPIFISVVLSTCLGMVYSIFGTYTMVCISGCVYCTCTEPTTLQAHAVCVPFDLAFIKFISLPRALVSALAPFAIDITLLLRMLVVYPPSLMPVSTSVLLFSPPIILKIIRVVSWVLWAMSIPKGATTTEEYISVTTGEKKWSVVGDAVKVLDEA